MRRFAVVGAALLAVLALTAVVASSAVAALPEFLPSSGVIIGGSSGAGELQIQGGGTVKCEKDKPLGEITGPKTATIDVHFEGCKALGFAANSVDDKAKAGVILVKGTALLCYLSKAAKTVGLLVTISPKLEIEVPTAKTIITVEGSVIGEVKPINKSQTTGEVIFTQKEGKPGIEKCEGEAADVLLAKEGTGAFKVAGEKTTESLTFTPALEVMA